MQQLPPRDEGQKKSVEAKCGINKWLKVWTWQTVQSLRGRSLTNTKPRLSNILAAKMLCWDGRAYKYAAGEGGEHYKYSVGRRRRTYKYKAGCLLFAGGQVGTSATYATAHE